jgi:serine/threonine protein kinase
VPLSSDCPNAPLLRRLLLSELSEPELELVEQHLTGCGQCSERLRALHVQDPWAEAVRSGANTPLEAVDESLINGYCRLIERNGEMLQASPPTKGAPSAGARPDEDHDFLAPAQAAGEIGRLGTYRVLRVLGAGGMGVVFQAEDPSLKRLVALKVLRPALAASDRARQRFLREARAAAAVKHDHIVTIYQVGEAGDIPFLSMELLHGEALDARLGRRGKLPSAEVLRIGRQTAEGLAAAHESGLVHRDIKPANLWLEGEPGSFFRVKILDFGLVAHSDRYGPLQTRPGTVLGTPSYMAPEQAAGETVGPRADLFSLGCVLYQASTGELPFPGESIYTVLGNLAAHEPVPPCQLNAALSTALSDLILRLLAKRPEHRPASARAVAEALRSLEGSSDSAATILHSSARQPRHRPIVQRAAAVVLGAACLGALIYGSTHLSVSPPPSTELAPPALPTLKGYIDVQIWEEGNPRRHNLRLNDASALPLKADDQYFVDVELNRPAFLYVLWIDTEGKVHPVYPWRPGHWDERPAEEKPVSRLRRPEAADEFYEVPKGPPGMESLLLLARDTPLPREVNLRAELGTLPRQREQDIRATVWFENGEVVRNETGRAGRFDVKRRDDPVLETQQRIRTKLQRYFTYTRAVSFANQGK